MVAASITGLAHGVPAPMDQAELWRDYFDAHYAGNPVAAKVWQHAGITTRHGVVDPRVEDVATWGTGRRMERFQQEAPALGREAIGKALAQAGLDPTDVGLLAVVSCTGYGTPGLDITLARELAMSASVQRLHIGHMGCYAAIPGLAAVRDFVLARQQPAVLLCCELTSLHVQPATDELQQMVAHALFSDAAAAVVVEPRAGLEVVDTTALTDPTTADHMTWDVTDLGFRMGLSPKVPDVLGEHVLDWTRSFLATHGLEPGDVDQWVVHPGGRRILEVVGDELGVPAARLRASYDVLNRFGNCSSATVLLVLEESDPLPPGGVAVAMAFGPGLTLYAALLRQG